MGELTSQEIGELVNLYKTAKSARRLLISIGLPIEGMYGLDSAREVFTVGAEKIRQGVLANGPELLRAAVRIDFPGNMVFAERQQPPKRGNSGIRVTGSTNVRINNSQGPARQDIGTDRRQYEESPVKDNDNWWQRLCKRGAVVALCIIVGTVIAILTFLGLTPGR